MLPEEMLKTSAVWLFSCFVLWPTELKVFGWQVEIEMKVRMIHTEMFGLLPINYQGLSTQEWLYIKIQSKANQHSLTSKDYQQAGGKTSDNHLTLVNPDFPTLRNPKHHGFICLQAFEKKPFCTSQQERRSQPPTPPASATWSRALHSCTTRFGQGTEAGAGRALLLPHLSANTRKLPSRCCNAEPKAQPNQRFCYASVSVGKKILSFTAIMQLYAYLSNAGITITLQNRPWKEIISDLTIRFALHAVLET